MSSAPAISRTAAVTGRACPGVGGGWMARLVVPAAGLTALAIFVALYALRPEIYFVVLSFIGVDPVKIPFFDLEYVLAGTECWRRGVDVYIDNPCDLASRPWDYSPLLLRAWFLGNTALTTPLGLIMDAAFFCSFAAFPPPRDCGALLAMLAAVMSQRVAFAAERGNIDVIIFIAMVAAAVLSVGPTARRMFGYGILAFLGLLKIYPFVALGLGLRERPRVLFGIAAATAAIFGWFVWFFHAEFAGMAAVIPAGDSRDFIGAVNVPAALGKIIWQPYGAVLIWAGLLARASAQVARLVRWTDFRAALTALPRLEANFLVLGALVTDGCFFTGQSVGYRGIYLLLALPAIAAMASRDGGIGVFARRTRIVIVLLMWEGLVTWAGAIPKFVETLAPPIGRKVFEITWLLGELVWWHLAAILAAVLVCFVLESDVAKALLGTSLHRSAPEAR